MSRKNIIIGVGAGMISILALANQASADTRRFRSSKIQSTGASGDSGRPEGIV